MQTLKLKDVRYHRHFIGFAHILIIIPLIFGDIPDSNLTMAIIAVAGGAGGVGKTIVQALSKANHEVIVLGRSVNHTATISNNNTNLN